MKRMLTGVLAAATVLAMAVPATAHEGEDDELPPHGHMLVQRLDAEEVVVEIDGEEMLKVTLTFRKCVDLAGGKPVPNNAHHANLHTGSAGDALRDRAGHFVIPTGFTPWDDCADLAQNPVIYEALPDEE